MEDHTFRGGFARVPRFGAPSGGVEGGLRRVPGPGGRAGARGGLGGARRALRGARFGSPGPQVEPAALGRSPEV